MYDLRTKDIKFELKSVGESGEFEGFAAIYGIRDDAGDVIHRGAFARTLHHKGGKFPILWQHQINEPLGFLTATDTETGLYVKGRFNLEVTRAREVHALMKQAKAEGVPFGLSIGYDAINPKWEGNTRHLHEIRLWEVSPTLFPAQPAALIAAVKQAGRRPEGKPFGPYESFQDCVSANRDKEHPEGFCAWLHHELTGEWPVEAMRKAQSPHWEQRVQAMFEASPEIRLSREQVKALCPSCAAKMEQSGIGSLILTRASIKQMPEQLLEGLCNTFGDDPGFFTRCVDGISGVDDPEAFCAWLHQECLGTWPAEEATAMHKASQYLSAASEKLAALLRPAGLSQAGGSDSTFASLWALLHEIRTDARRRSIA